MRIALIRPSLGQRAGRRYRTPALLQPLALPILAALTPRQHQLTAIDERLEPVPFEQAFGLVALSVCTFSARRGYEIAAEFRRRGVPVVMGGFHPTLLPDEAQQHADAIALGDAEGCWPQIVADAEAGRLAARYGDASSGPRAAITPDRSVLRGKRYLPMQVVEFNRGCHRRCEFCAVRAFYGGQCQRRSVDDVVAELRALRPHRVFFADDNIAVNREALKQLLEQLIPLKLRWTSQADLRFADDPELLELARRSGCQSLVIGFESLDERNLKQMGKSWNRASSYHERLDRLRQAGILVYGTFVHGYDADGPDVFEKNLRFAVDERLFLANFNPLQPLPGTPLFARLAAEQRLPDPQWWLSRDYRWHDALFDPAGMSREQLSAGCCWAREQFHSSHAIAQRFSASAAHRRNLDNALIYFASNIVSRLDIQAKSGLGLGSSTRGAG